MTKRILKLGVHYSSGLALLIIALLALSGKAVVSKERTMPDHREDDEKQLLAIVRDKEMQDKDRRAVVQAVVRLGEIRSIAAIDDLINLITFRGILESKQAPSPIVIDMEHPVTPLSVYPATGALFHIGRPALPALIKLIETSDPDALASQNADTP